MYPAGCRVNGDPSAAVLTKRDQGRCAKVDCVAGGRERRDASGEAAAYLRHRDQENSLGDVDVRIAKMIVPE